MLALEKPSGGRSTDLAAPLKRMAGLVRKRGAIILLSDFLTPIGHLEPELIALAASGHELMVFQVLDPAELTFEFGAAAMFQDAETGKALFIDPSVARKEYLKRFEAHCAGLRPTCQPLGIVYNQLGTGRPPAI